MKKALFFIVALASVAIGCTKSEVIKAPGRGREIKFDTYVGKTPVTKAESADLDYLKRPLGTTDAPSDGGFQVYGFLHTYVEPTTQAPADGEEVYNGSDSYVDVSTIATNATYMDKIVNWTEGADGAEGYWDYPGVVYWPDYSTKRRLAFAAWALNVKDNIVWDTDPNVGYNEKTGHPAEQSYTKFTYTVPTAVKDQKDLMVTPFLPNQGLTENTNAASVKLNFKHLLSRVGFQVVANQDGAVVIDIKDIKLHGNFPKAGKVDLKGNGVIEPITGEGAEYETSYSFFRSSNYYFSTTSSKTAVDIFENRERTAEVGGEGQKVEERTDNSNRYMMIMPSKQVANGTIDEEGNLVLPENTLPGAYIEVVYQLTDADVQRAMVSLDGWEFKPGTSYTFIFKVSTSSVEFEVNVEQWTEYFAPDGTNEDGSPYYPNGDGVHTLIPIV